MNRTILVPIDISDSELTQRVISHVEAEAKIDDAEVHFLTVIPSLPYYASLGLAYSAELPAMDDLKALLTDHLREPPDSRADGNLHHAGVDTKLPGVLGKFTLAETDEPHLLSKTMQQRQHVRLRAADVAARDQCYHFHIGTLIFELPLVSCGKIQ